VLEFTGINITAINDKYKAEYTKDADIVIMAVDDMAVRREIAEALTTNTKRMIDCRMAGQFFELYSYIPVYELPMYLATRYSNEDASPVTCTSKSTSFNTFAIAAFITRFVVGVTKDDKVILNKSQLTVDLYNLMIA
jgi:molybdopterin/thiamine biosynthesis adenylyltransferase